MKDPAMVAGGEHGGGGASNSHGGAVAAESRGTRYGTRLSGELTHTHTQSTKHKIRVAYSKPNRYQTESPSSFRQHHTSPTSL